MRLRVLGSNGTYPTLGRPASGYLLQHDGGSLLLDCGPGVFAELHALGVLPDGIVLSHRHGDHCLDLLALFNYLRADRPDVTRVPVLAPEGVIASLAGFFAAAPDHEFFRVFAGDVVAPGDTRTVGPFSLTFGEAVHPVPAVTTKVVAGGSVLVYSGDTGPGPDLVRLATGADLLVCEATSQGEPPAERYPYHLFAGEAGEVAAAAGVQQLIVTHLAPTLDPAVSVTEAASAFSGPVRHAEPRMEVEF